ncbi:MAG TPA: hypothetical protein VM639_20840 [Dongiaceae bacterium]|nr:hypothetical protein [Dongiaceae bacterium]
MNETVSKKKSAWIIALAIVIVAAGAIGWFTYQREAAQPAIDAAAYKSVFLDNCLKQANTAALQQGKSYNEEQKRILQQVCSCGADRTLQQFTPQDIAAFQANPNDGAMLERIKGIMQSCATATVMPATNP